MTSSADNLHPLLGRRTPPALKWLLNERAALLGDAQRLGKRAELLIARLAKLEEDHARSRLQLEAVLDVQMRRHEGMSALDMAMHLIQPAVDPAAGGTVTAWAGRYGERGVLTQFVRSVLERVAPAPLSLIALRSLAVVQFGLSIATRAEQETLRSAIRTALVRLRGQGLVELLPKPGPAHSSPMWRWTSAPSIGDIRALDAGC